MNAAEIRERYPVGRTRPLIVTEVTRMRGDYRCVAAWDVHANRIVRPLQQDGTNWPIARDRSVFYPGNVLACVPYGPRRGGALPHLNEDLPLATTPTVLASLDDAELFTLLLPLADRTIQAAFREPLIDHKYVNEATDCPSLGCVLVRRRNASFVEGFGKLRFRFRDADGIHYDLGVTSDVLLDMFSPNDPDAFFGVDEANEWLEVNPPAAQVILRVGMARGWSGPEGVWNPLRCYLQLNGIITQDNYFSIFAG